VITTRLPAPELMPERFARSRWFRHDRFGMFIHWGPYSVWGRGEWVRSHERIGIAEYQDAVDRFGAEHYDPQAWADLAADAGMKYAVLTAKHHDGFCLFDSALTDYTSMHNGIGRDLVREFLDAFRARGIKVGLYFSLLDWHRPDYPHFGDEIHPHREDPAYAEHRPDLDSYREFMHGQIRELCTNYGELDLLWFDFSYTGMGPEQWGAEEIVRLVRELQPNALMDNRLETSGGGHGSIATLTPNIYSGDFVSPEQIIPVEGIRAEDGAPVPWEACVTLNNNWGHAHDDDLWKSTGQLITKLVECVAKGGNLLLNIGRSRATVARDWCLAGTQRRVDLQRGPRRAGHPRMGLLHTHRYRHLRPCPAPAHRPVAPDRPPEGRHRPHDIPL
jgi:alpha-L-fucosidase